MVQVKLHWHALESVALLAANGIDYAANRTHEVLATTFSTLTIASGHAQMVC